MRVRTSIVTSAMVKLKRCNFNQKLILISKGSGAYAMPQRRLVTIFTECAFYYRTSYMYVMYCFAESAG